MGWHSARAPTGPAASPFFTELLSAGMAFADLGKESLLLQALTLYVKTLADA